MTDPDLPGLLTDWERARLREWDAAPDSTLTAVDFRQLRAILQSVLERTGPFFDEAYRRGLEWQRDHGDGAGGRHRRLRRRDVTGPDPPRR